MSSDERLPFFVFKGNRFFGTKPDPARCAAASMGSGHVSTQCSNRAKFEEEGHRWCGVHRPSTVRARRQARDKKWKAKWAMSKQRSEASIARAKIASVAIDVYSQRASFDDLERAVYAYLEEKQRVEMLEAQNAID